MPASLRDLAGPSQGEQDACTRLPATERYAGRNRYRRSWGEDDSRDDHDGDGGQHRQGPHQGADRARASQARGPHAGVEPAVRARGQGDARRRPLIVPGERPVAGLHRAGLGVAGLGRRRQRVHRLPQRLRRHVHRPCEPHRGRCREGTRRRRHPLRGPHRRLDHRRRGAHQAVRPAPVALHELRHRVHDGRGAPRPRRHRPRHDPQDRGLLPRPPRRGDGVGVSGPRGARASATIPARWSTARATPERSPT